MLLNRKARDEDGVIVGGVANNKINLETLDTAKYWSTITFQQMQKQPKQEQQNGAILLQP